MESGLQSRHGLSCPAAVSRHSHTCIPHSTSAVHMSSLCVCAHTVAMNPGHILCWGLTPAVYSPVIATPGHNRILAFRVIMGWQAIVN